MSYQHFLSNFQYGSATYLVLLAKPHKFNVRAVNTFQPDWLTAGFFQRSVDCCWDICLLQKCWRCFLHLSADCSCLNINQQVSHLHYIKDLWTPNQLYQCMIFEHPIPDLVLSLCALLGKLSTPFLSLDINTWLQGLGSSQHASSFNGVTNEVRLILGHPWFYGLGYMDVGIVMQEQIWTS